MWAHPSSSMAHGGGGSRLHLPGQNAGDSAVVQRQRRREHRPRLRGPRRPRTLRPPSAPDGRGPRRRLRRSGCRTQKYRRRPRQGDFRVQTRIAVTVPFEELERIFGNWRAARNGKSALQPAASSSRHAPPSSSSHSSEKSRAGSCTNRSTKRPSVRARSPGNPTRPTRRSVKAAPIPPQPHRAVEARQGPQGRSCAGIDSVQRHPLRVPRAAVGHPGRRDLLRLRSQPCRIACGELRHR